MLLEVTFLSPDFHEWCHSMMSVCLLAEVMQQWATLVLGWVTASVHYTLSYDGSVANTVDRNPFWPFFSLSISSQQILVQAIVYTSVHLRCEVWRLMEMKICLKMSTTCCIFVLKE